jgi:hypothetical protein
MAELLRLFISATHDLESARAVVGRTLAALPVQVGVEIRRTPAAGATIESMHELIANVDRFYFLLGEDISAPAGAEWFLAWRLERSILPLRRGSRLTPAAAQFVREAPVQWTRFSSSADLARILTLDVVRLLNHPANRYGLTVSELERLAAHAERAQRSPEALLRLAGPAYGEPGGAEGGGVLLDLGHREPLLGVALDEADSFLSHESDPP